MARAVRVFKDNAICTRTLERERTETENRRTAENDQIQRETEAATASEAAALVAGSIGTGLERLAAGDLTFRLGNKLPPAYAKLGTNLNSAKSSFEYLGCVLARNAAWPLR
jgi:methyl-accepting chemotaxis protein